MRVLIGCEESGVGRRAFRALGHEAWSCDLIPARDGSPWHYQCDVMRALRLQRWDLIILHPSCRTMTVAGNKHYGRGMPRHHERLAEQEWSARLWNEACEVCYHVALENPVSTIWAAIDEKPQYIHPWQFGHPEQKKTGLIQRPQRELRRHSFCDGFAMECLPLVEGRSMTYEFSLSAGLSSSQVPAENAGGGMSPSATSFLRLPMAAGTLCAAAPVTAQPRVANPTATLGILRQPGTRGAVRFRIGATEWRCYSPTGALVKKPAKPERRLFIRFFRVLLSAIHAHTKAWSKPKHVPRISEAGA